MRSKRLLLVATTVAAATAAGVSAFVAVAGPPQLEVARQATAQDHRIDVAKDAGYGPFTDAQGIACIEMPGMGAMGVHYVNGALVGDPAIDAAKPEALVYEPEQNGTLRLVGLEYVVIQSAWDATHSARPTLFGQEFNFTSSPNRYGLPPFYSLHAWIWHHNPAGMFAPFNPDITCANA
jgi:hypothetical protein